MHDELASIRAGAAWASASTGCLQHELDALRNGDSGGGNHDSSSNVGALPSRIIVAARKRAIAASSVGAAPAQPPKGEQWAHLANARAKAHLKRPAAAISGDGRAYTDIVTLKQIRQNLVVPSSILTFLRQPVVSRSAAHQFYRQLLPLAPYTNELAKFAKDGHRAKEDQLHVVSFNKYYLGLSKKPYNVMNRTVTAAVMGVPYKYLLKRLVRLASLCLQQDRVTRWLIEYRLANSALEFRLIVYVESDRNDETPMWVTALSALTLANDDEQLPDVIADPESKAFDTALRKLATMLPQMVTEAGNKSLCKLLNSELKWGALIQRKADGELIKMRGKSLSWVQHLEKNSAPCMTQAELERCASSSNADAFELPVLMTCHDRYAATRKQVKETFVVNRSDNWEMFDTECQHHMLNGGKAKIAKRILSETTSGCKHLAISVKGGAAMQGPEKALADAILEPGVLVIHSGAPPSVCETIQQASP